MRREAWPHEPSGSSNLIRKGYLFSAFLILLFPLLFVGSLPPGAWTAPAPFRRQASARTYRFKACVESNGGVSPFKVGSLITGTFTYDLKGKHDGPPQPCHGTYKSALNSLAFQVGDLRFFGTGDVDVTTGAFEEAEHFQIVASDLRLPRGWEMDHTRRSQTYSFLLQNAPSKKVVASPAIPNRVSLSDFVTTRELHLDFFHGVRFPGGRVKDRATVHAKVKSLEEVRR